MLTVGAFAAKTHLSALLDRAAGGEEIIITRHGKPVARLVSAIAADNADITAAIAKLRQLRAGTRLGSLDWQALRDAGRR